MDGRESNSKKSGKKCFVITPIGDVSSDTFRKAKGVIESVIKPVLKKDGFDDIKPSYEINESGMISNQIINRIMNDDLVIANLTGTNPNVMYELCLRHVIAKPIIHICEYGTGLPFDIKDSRTIFYDDDMLGVDELKTKMSAFLSEIRYDIEHKDNPIYSANKHWKVFKEIDDGESNKSVMNEMVMELINEMSELKYEIKSYKNMKYTDEKQMRDIGLYNMNKMRVYELAKRLNISSEKLIESASKVGIILSSPASSIKSSDALAIIESL